MAINQAITSLSAITLAFLTFFLAKYTKTLAIEAKKTRKQQSEPHVIVTAVHDFERPSIVMIVIKNIGHGLASNISFKASKNIVKAFGTDEKSVGEAQPITGGPLVSGIPTLGPGETRIIDWGQYYGLKKVYGEAELTVDCSFYFGEVLLPTVQCKIDVESFAGTIANEGLRLRGVKALESIAQKIK
ncbi:hypothetical protein [Pseudodesulfovibrio karagichevae]|uniref:Uncharacterized protein n=1 Tax=Pseudodesulfovibrio karagichevae TaxID=3239305 RepID=A0ABV4K7F7_9BACT